MHMHKCDSNYYRAIMGRFTLLNWFTVEKLHCEPVWSCKRDHARTTHFGPGHKCCGPGYIFATT